MEFYRFTIFLLLIPLVSSPVFADDATDATQIRPPKSDHKILCPTVKINDTELNKNEQEVATTFKSSDCMTDSAGAVVIVLGAGGGNLSGDCPNDYPYLTRFESNWGFYATAPICIIGFAPPAIGYGGAGTSYTCCKSPTIKVQLTTAWVSPNNKGTCPNT